MAMFKRYAQHTIIDTFTHTDSRAMPRATFFSPARHAALPRCLRAEGAFAMLRAAERARMREYAAACHAVLMPWRAPRDDADSRDGAIIYYSALMRLAAMRILLCRYATPLLYAADFAVTRCRYADLRTMRYTRCRR